MYNVEKNQKGYTAVCLCRRRLADEDGEHFAIKRMQKISQSKKPNFFFSLSQIYFKSFVWVL